MSKIKLFDGKIKIIIVVFLFLIVGICLLWTQFFNFKNREGLYVSVADNTVNSLNSVVKNNRLANINDISNNGAPIVFSDTPPVAKLDGPDPEFPMEGSILQCVVDDINGNGSYYMVSDTNPKTINLFPNDDRSVINSWSDTWATAPQFKNCSAFTRGPTMERRAALPDVGTDLHCKNEDSHANRRVYRVMTKTKIQQFPGYEDDPNQIVAKSWGVQQDKLVDIDDCSNLNRVHNDLGKPKTFKYKPDVKALERKLVKCNQTKLDEDKPLPPPGNHGTDAVYKVENKKLRWFQSVPNAYTSLENLISWGLGKTPVVDVPVCDNIELGENIHFKGHRIPKGSYTKCAIDVPGGAGVGQIYKVVGDDGKLSWTVSNEIASFFDPNFNTSNPTFYTYYPDCSSFTRDQDITKYGPEYYKDYTNAGTYTLKIPPGCIGLRAITVGGGGGGGGGCNGWEEKWHHDGGGGCGGGGGGGAVVFFNGNYSVPIDDNNRNSQLKIVVGNGGHGGRRGDWNWRGGNNTSGGNGGNSYIALVASNNETRYFEAGGGGGGERGGFNYDWRGKNGDGGSGGSVVAPEKYVGYTGTNGETYPADGNPYHDIGIANGGQSVNVPSNVPNGSNYGKGGDGGVGSASWVDHASAGKNGTTGFVRIIFLF